MPPEGPQPAAASGVPAWVLLDTTVLIGRRANVTTARALTSAGRPIEVSFELADLPALSRCLVHCPDLTPPPDSDGDMHYPYPCVTGADGAFVLINVVLPERDGGGCLAWTFTDVFVYRAGGAPPSLDLIQRPYPVGLHETHFGVLSFVVPERRVEADGLMGYDLHVFSTETQSWGTKAATVDTDLEWYHGDFYHTKVFSTSPWRAARWPGLISGTASCCATR
ncbi:unnamed protein product [Urochloa humidicola]